jgi:hypothetical protein
MGFRVPTSQGRALPPVEIAGIAEISFFRALPNFFTGNVLEFGCRSGALAETVLESQPQLTSYTGTGELNEVRVTLGPKFSFRPSIPGETFDLPSGSFDCLITFYLLEQLKMDHLYMVLSDARRLLKPGGLWAIQSHVPGVTWGEKAGSFLWRARGVPLLELSHFLSPEDWAVVSDAQLKSWGLISRRLVLRRLPE